MKWTHSRVKIRTGEILAYSSTLPDGNVRVPVAVLFHGFASSRFNETNSALAPLLVAQGVGVVVVDLSGHGESTGRLEGSDIISASHEIIDVVSHVGSQMSQQPRPMALLGNSFSGNAAILAASQLDLVALALKAPVSDYEHTRNHQLGTEVVGNWEHERFTEFESGLRLNFSGIEAARSVNTFERFADIAIPVTIWQGTDDQVIPRDDWMRLEALCDGQHKRFIRVENADHRISPPHFDWFISEVGQFLAEALLKANANG